MSTRRRWPWAAGAAVVAAGAITAAFLIPPPGPLLAVPDDTDAAIARIEAAVPGALEAAHVPGAAVAVVRDGGTVWSAGFGTADDGSAVTSGTPFQIGSISKPVAAATILTLVDDGTLALDAPLALGDWLLPGATDAVTLRRLLSHTAGTSAPGYLGTPADEPLPSTVESLEGGSSADPVAVTSAIGSYAYSGGGYTVAQLAAETATGLQFSELAAERVLRPLGMNASNYACTTTAPDDVQAGHDLDGAPTPRYLYTEAAAAGLCSTADDLARFVAWLASGDPRADLMATPQDGTDGRYGLGLELGASRDGVVVAHPGVNRGFYSYIAAVPAAGFGVVVLTNGDGGSAVVDAVLDALDP